MASKLPQDMEVYCLFAHLLPAIITLQGEDLEWAQARQGLVLDFCLRLPTPLGPTDSRGSLILKPACQPNFPAPNLPWKIFL